MILILGYLLISGFSADFESKLTFIAIFSLKSSQMNINLPQGRRRPGAPGPDSGTWETTIANERGVLREGAQRVK
jgi:hypothetical protein